MKNGIDVSKYNGVIDWVAVKASGIDFVYIKATQGREVHGSGRMFEDARFKSNIVGASAVGLDIGVYHYLTASDASEATLEAELFLSAIAPYRSLITLHAVCDVEEDKYLPKNRSELTAVVDAFCSRVEGAGYDAMVYSNPSWLKNRFDCHYPLWLALWREDGIIPYEYGAEVWQYTDKATVGGISGQVDMNLYLAEREDTNLDNLDNKSSDWSREAVAWAIANGILYGDGTGSLRLREPCTREQMCVLLWRMYKLLTGGKS